MTTPAKVCEYCNGHDCPECDVNTTPANEWRENYNVFVKDVREYGDFPESLASHVEKFIEHTLDQHSAHLVERTQGLEKVLKEIRNIEDLRMKEAQKKNELYDASVRQWATVGLRILDDQAIDIVSGK